MRCVMRLASDKRYGWVMLIVPDFLCIIKYVGGLMQQSCVLRYALLLFV